MFRIYETDLKRARCSDKESVSYIRRDRNGQKLILALKWRYAIQRQTSPFRTVQCTVSLDKMTTPAAPSCAASVCETCMSSDWLPVSMWCISCTGMDFKNRSCKGNLQSVASDKRARLFLLRQQDEEKVGLKRTPGRQKRNTPIFLAQMSLLFPLLPSRRARRFVA